MDFTKDKVIKEIGRGGYSIVRLVEKNGVKLARKEIDMSKMTQEDVKSTQDEINMLSGLRDRTVLIYKEHIYDIINKKYYIYTEYLENGDLYHLISEYSMKGKYFDEKV